MDDLVKLFEQEDSTCYTNNAAIFEDIHITLSRRDLVESVLAYWKRGHETRHEKLFLRRLSPAEFWENSDLKNLSLRVDFKL